jgi:hypothetical protein
VAAIIIAMRTAAAPKDKYLQVRFIQQKVLIERQIYKFNRNCPSDGLNEFHHRIAVFLGAENGTIPIFGDFYRPWVLRTTD